MKPLDILAQLCAVYTLDRSHQDILSQMNVADAEALVRHLYPELKNNPIARQSLECLASQVQRGAMDIHAWLGQIMQVYEWLAGQSRTAKFADILEYISCSVEGSSLQVGHDIGWYLEQYGFEKSRPM